ncbi:MAG: hypothetical protein ACLP4W_18100 [Mycobacterium sp.]|uniref:hypothetical protein n=1 Tax=Mycobacterium sp. TaxID=1785 RepID=UPI003F977D93
MTDRILTDAQIAALTPEQRRELISRLEQPLSDVIDPLFLARVRRIRLRLMVGCSIAMVPWLGYLSWTLPANYVAHNWPVTWVGFDILLVAFMLATAIFGYLRRQVLLFAAFTSGVLLICDAWFDIMTAGPDDIWLSMVTALLIEVPLAIFMIRGAQRIMRLTMMRLWLLDPEVRLWQVPLFP